MKKARFILLMAVFSVCIMAQKPGTPLLRYYAPAEYKGFAQNWCAVQDDRGVMYFGNGKGILEYNGKTWRRFPTEQHTTVLCMTKDKSGRIYIGGDNEIGYLAPDSSGEMRFVSLNKYINEKEKNFTYVWAVHATEDGVCFAAGEKVICWDGKKMSYYAPKSGFFTSFCVNNKLYIISTGVGLMKLDKGKLELLPGTESLTDASVRYVGAYGQKLFIAGRKGCFTYENGNLQKLNTGLETLFTEKGLYKGALLPDGNFALGTMGGGVFVVNGEGNILEAIDESKGLEGKSVYALYVDREKEVWLAQENGLTRLNYSSPIRILDGRHGLHGIIRTLVKTDEGLFAATFQGLFQMGAGGNFSIRNKINTGANVSMPFGKSSLLLCAGEIGTVEVKGEKTIIINNDPYVLSMHVASQDSNVVIAGSVDKAYVFRKENEKWITLCTIDSLGDEINTITQVNNTFWLSTTNKGKVFSIDFKDGTWDKYKLNAYDTLNGLPTGLLEVYACKNQLYLGTEAGVLTFNEQQKKFVPDNSIWKMTGFDPASYAYLLQMDPLGRPWALTNDGFGYFEKDSFNYAPFKRIGFSDYYALHCEPNGTAWLGGTNGIAVYTPNSFKSYATPFNTLITRLVHRKDTLFKGNYFSEGMVSLEQNEHFKYSFPYKSNTVLFEYASPFFDNEEALFFSYKLDGFDNEWSAWVKETRKEYTNLHEGAYTFMVKSKNIYGSESSVAKFEFSILSPWYRTWWAFTLYVVLAILLIYLVIKIQTARLRSENEKLEKIVNERTAEVVKQKEEIESQNEKLQLAYDEIEEKQKEILDSIHYAKRIQNSLLPNEKYLTKALGRLKKK